MSDRHRHSPVLARAAASAVLGLAGGIFLLPVPACEAAPMAAPATVFTQIADEVSGKMLASATFQERAKGGRKARIVIGDVRNNSDDEGVRVEDVFNEIRNQIVATGTARLFAPGELNVDFVIAPELTSDTRMENHKRRHCFTLQLTLTTISGEYIAAHSATRCE